MMQFLYSDQTVSCPDDEFLIRAKRHVVSGKEKLRAGRVSLGILKLYNALNSAAQWYISLPGHRESLPVTAFDNLNDGKTIFEVLVRAGLIHREFSYDAMNELVHMALKKDMSTFDYSSLIRDVESVMAGLGIIQSCERESLSAGMSRQS
ncbi:MAG: hypothetical protein JSU90_07880 [Nitrospiraceae bacterium]|nr:MAG: hypothetical protein JSU90_07880 [Nitrospiraceae bacterium]